MILVIPIKQINQYYLFFVFIYYNFINLMKMIFQDFDNQISFGTFKVKKNIVHSNSLLIQKLLL
jgi:hypothetical protein